MIHQPTHSDDASGEPDLRRQPSPTDALEEADGNGRIDAAIRRLFSPPAVWPPMSNDVDDRDRCGINGAQTNGRLEEGAQAQARGPGSAASTNGYSYNRHRLRLPLEAAPASSRAPEPATTGRRRALQWMKRVAVAACLMLGLVGAWNIWSEFRSPRYHIVQPQTVDISHLYREYSSAGAGAASERERDPGGKWTIPETPIAIALDDAGLSEHGIEFLDVRRCSTVHRDVLLVRVAGEPVVLFAGYTTYRYTLSTSCSEQLHLHERTVGPFTVYELTPHAWPGVLAHLECAGAGCAVTCKPQCGSEP